MIKKIIFSLLIFVILFQLSANSQRLNFGFGFNFLGFYTTHFKENIVFADHSYKAYYVNKTQFSTAGAYQFNFLTNLDYGRSTFTLELGYFVMNDGLVTKLSYPVAGNNFENYYSKISYGGYCITPIVSNVFSSRRMFKLYAEAGLPFMILNKALMSETVSYESRKGGSLTYLKDKNEMINEFGMTHDYFNILVGIGFKSSMFSISLRYINKINKINDPANNLGYFTLNMSVYTKFSKIKKHYLYIE
ncbi:MAG: hypothetical protein HY951_12155 [Bacteroidia bacterium]|nr:hypothetical protein [Bacteroidia bacterium]